LGFMLFQFSFINYGEKKNAAKNNLAAFLDTR